MVQVVCFQLMDNPLCFWFFPFPVIFYLFCTSVLCHVVLYFIYASFSCVIVLIISIRAGGSLPLYHGEPKEVKMNCSKLSKGNLTKKPTEIANKTTAGASLIQHPKQIRIKYKMGVYEKFFPFHYILRIAPRSDPDERNHCPNCSKPYIIKHRLWFLSKLLVLSHPTPYLSLKPTSNNS